MCQEGAVMRKWFPLPLAWFKRKKKISWRSRKYFYEYVAVRIRHFRNKVYNCRFVGNVFDFFFISVCDICVGDHNSLTLRNVL